MAERRYMIAKLAYENLQCSLLNSFRLGSSDCDFRCFSKYDKMYHEHFLETVAAINVSKNAETAEKLPTTTTCGTYLDNSSE